MLTCITIVYSTYLNIWEDKQVRFSILLKQVVLSDFWVTGDWSYSNLETDEFGNSLLLVKLDTVDCRSA